MTTYVILATPSRHGWNLHIEGVGTTHTASLARAFDDANACLDLALGPSARELIIRVTYGEVGPDARPSAP